MANFNIRMPEDVHEEIRYKMVELSGMRKQQRWEVLRDAIKLLYVRTKRGGE